MNEFRCKNCNKLLFLANSVDLEIVCGSCKALNRIIHFTQSALIGASVTEYNLITKKNERKKLKPKN